MTRHGRNGGAAAAPGHVRIIGGAWRGTRLPVADSDGLRPTSDRTRETLFNWLQPVLPGARVLDLFAGSGALGFEALSRGAREALMVERDPRQCAVLGETVRRLQGGEAATVVQADALSFLRAPLHGRFDVVFVDPPFAADAWSPVFDALPPWVADDARLYVELPLRRSIDPGPQWMLHREGATRETRYLLFRRALRVSAD